MKSTFALFALPLVASAAILPRATTIPAHTGIRVLPSVHRVPAGGSYDGGMKRIDVGHGCELDVSYGDDDIVFILGEGATLSNVIIGPAQKKGVHCLGSCTLKNVWWSRICDYGLNVVSQKEGQKTVVIGGGAIGSTGGVNVIESAGAGTVEVSNFFVKNFNSLYKSCGACQKSVARHVVLSGITAQDGKDLVSINANFGDSARITKSNLVKVANVCTKFKGVPFRTGQAVKVGSGNDGKNCIYGSDVVSA